MVDSDRNDESGSLHARRDDLVVVVAGGETPSPLALAACDSAGLLIAADGGALHAVRVGLRVDVLIGDLDSTEPEVVAEVEAAGTRVVRYPTDKDASDLELALETATAHALKRAATVVVVGIHGARPDHELTNIALLASPRWRSVPMQGWLGESLVQVAWPERPVRVRGRTGSTVSLVPLGGSAQGVRTTGLRYPLSGNEVRFGSSLGLSNVLTGEVGSVAVSKGPLLVVQPDFTEVEG